LLRFLAYRLVATLPVVLGVAVVVFLILRLAPGDPAVVLAGDTATPETVAEIREQLGLDEPLVTQFVTWVGLIVQGDLGVSIISGKPVSTLILQRVEPTLSLAATTFVLSILFAVPLGIIAAWRHQTWVDRSVMAVSVFGFSIPAFVLGYLLVYAFAVHLKWFPVQGFKSLSLGIGPFLSSMALPTITLSLFYGALVARITRASLLEILGEDYIRTARAKGVGEVSVMTRHALQVAAGPIISIIGIGLAMLISGALITESVFNLPGLGRLTVDAVMSRDYPVIQGLILVLSFAYILINLLVDIAYAAVDPRIRY
jgi:peptide/nickel transport system permease protein